MNIRDITRDNWIEGERDRCLGWLRWGRLEMVKRMPMSGAFAVSGVLNEMQAGIEGDEEAPK